MEQQSIMEALQNRSIRQAAKHLGTSFTNLRYWIKKHDIPTPAPVPYKCAVCGENDPDKFYKKNKYCKKCFNKYCIERWIQRKIKAVEHKGGKCLKCGYDGYYGAFDFHHRDPATKEVDWNKLRLRSWDAIIFELDKCDLLCSRCHREIQWWHP